MKSNLKRVNRLDIVQAVSNNTRIPPAEVAEVINGFMTEIITQYHKNHMVELRGFGTFYPYFKKGRTYTIPRSKEKKAVRGRLTLKFKPAKRIPLYEKEKKPRTK
jgi:nucleoid DNA-binding protein